MNTGEISDDQLNGSGSSALLSDQLAHSIGVLRRRWVIVALFVVLAVIASLIVSSGEAKQYRATAKVLISPANENEINALLNPGANVTPADPERDLNTDVSQITEVAVGNQVRAKLRTSESSHSLIQQVSTSIEGTTNIADIVATDGDPARAATIANAFAAAYLTFRLTTIRGEIQQAIAAAQHQYASMGATAQAAPGGVQLATQIATLQAGEAIATPGVVINQVATAPTAPSSPKPSRDAIIAAVAGLLLGIVALVAFELLDRRVRDEDDVIATARLALLGTVPRRHRLAATAGRSWEEQESYSELALALLSRKLAPDANAVMVTSAGAEDGKTSVTIGLAAALAGFGQRVIVVECDLRRPRFASYLGLAATGQDLSAMLITGTVQPHMLVDVDAETLRPAERHGRAGDATNGRRAAPRFSVLQAGPVPPHPQGVLASAELEGLLRQLQSMADIVLIDTPPLAVVKDAAILAPWIDQVLVVARVGHTDRDALRATRAALEQTGSAVLGVVVLGGRRAGLGRYGPGLGTRVPRLRAPRRPDLDRRRPRPAAQEQRTASGSRPAPKQTRRPKRTGQAAAKVRTPPAEPVPVAGAADAVKDPPQPG